MKPLIRFGVLAAILFAAFNANAFTTGGFLGPYGVVVDPATNYIYVSSMNGDPSARDDNGFISRLKGDGSVDQLKFIDGSSSKITLHAPKGMAILGTTLYVADIDKLHAFDLATGNLLFDVNFGTLPVQHFYDVKLGPDNVLYVADGPGNTIYRVDVPRQHEVTTLVSGDSLGQPHAVVWFPTRQSFVVAGWSSGQVTAYDRSGKRQPYAAIFLRTLEGLDADDSGGMYVASSGLNAIYRIAPNFAIFGFQIGISTPAGLAFHRAGNQIIVASLETNTVQSILIQPPSGTKETAPTELIPLPPPVPTGPPAEAAAAAPAQPSPPAEKPPAEKPTAPEKPAAEKPPAPETPKSEKK